MLYLYAIADGLDRVHDVGGADGELLTIHTLEGMQVVAGERAAAPAIDAQALRTQDTVVRMLHARSAALLPMRFGASFGSRADLDRAMTLRAPTLRERLEGVRGREQMTLRVLGAIGASGATGAAGAAGAEDLSAVAPPGAGVHATGARRASSAQGAAYLRERAARRVPREVLPLLEALKPWPRATRVEAGRSPGVVATVYQLIDRGSSAEYEAAVKSAAGALPGLSIRVTGPAPCYAFT